MKAKRKKLSSIDNGVNMAYGQRAMDVYIRGASPNVMFFI